MNLYPGFDRAARISAIVASLAFPAWILCVIFGRGALSVPALAAYYACLAAMLVCLCIIGRNTRRLAGQFPLSSKKMRIFRVTAFTLWLLATICGLAVPTTVLLACSGAGGAARLICALSLPLAVIGWLGVLMGYRRRHQAALYEQNRRPQQ